MRIGILVLIVMSLVPPSAWALEAQDSEIDALIIQVQELRDALEQFQRAHEQEVDALEQKIRELTDKVNAETEVREEAPESGYQDLYQLPFPVYSGTVPTQSLSWQYFNPDISVIGDFLAQYTSHENEEDRPDDEFIFRELEVNFSGVLDPFARADITIAVEKEFEEDEDEEEPEEDSPGGGGHEHGFEVDVEEAYLTALTLPYGLQARAGRMREEFGKVNPAHLHALPWVDYPLVIQNYFGDEGLIGDGAEISWLAPTGHYLEVLYEIFNNSNGSSFAGEEYDDFAHLVRLRNLFELSDSTTFELGATAATAPSDSGHGGDRTWLEGVDVTLKWIPPEQALYRSLVWQTEVLASQKDTEDRGQQDTWGMYSSLGYRFSRRWESALRYDYSEFPDFEKFHEKGYSAYLTFLQSEYVFWRLGYMFIDRNFSDPEEEDEHLLWVQLNFGLGPHRAHEY